MTPFPTDRCPHCDALVLAFQPEADQLAHVVAALERGSKEIAAAELRWFAQCSRDEARAWIGHLLGCPRSWPLVPEDVAILQRLTAAFADVPRPEHFVRNPGHCLECEQYDEALLALDRRAVNRDLLGYLDGPLGFCSPAGIAYLLPELARFALLPDAWPPDWYGRPLAHHLAIADAFRRGCSPVQRRAVRDFLERLAYAQAALVRKYGIEPDLEVGTARWGTDA